MPLVTTELSETEFAKLQADMKTMGVAHLGQVMKAALDAFKPEAPPAPAAPEPAAPEPAAEQAQGEEHHG